MPSQLEEASPVKKNNNKQEFNQFNVKSESSSPASNAACKFLYHFYYITQIKKYYSIKLDRKSFKNLKII